MSQDRCEYCGQEERYGHNAICVMNTVDELRAEIERLLAILSRAKHHIRAALSLTEDNRLALAVQGRALVREIEAIADNQQLAGDK